MATKYDGANLSLMFDGTNEFNADGTAFVLDNEEADQEAVTFAELAAGDARQWFIQVTALGDYSAGSIWDLFWENSGQVIPYLAKPYGNAVPTAAQPHFEGTAKVIAKPPIGGTAGETWTYEARLDCQEVPERVIA
jgi:hypothetical protein